MGWFMEVSWRVFSNPMFLYVPFPCQDVPPFLVAYVQLFLIESFYLINSWCLISSLIICTYPVFQFWWFVSSLSTKMYKKYPYHCFQDKLGHQEWSWPRTALATIYCILVEWIYIYIHIQIICICYLAYVYIMYKYIYMYVNIYILHPTICMYICIYICTIAFNGSWQLLVNAAWLGVSTMFCCCFSLISVGHTGMFDTKTPFSATSIAMFDTWNKHSTG